MFERVALAERLQGTLKDIAARLRDIERELPRRWVGEYRRQELLTERSDLRRMHATTERKVQEYSAPYVRDEQRERFIDAVVASRRRDIERFIAKLEREGDHRQARIWRMQLLSLREQAEREFTA